MKNSKIYRKLWKLNHDINKWFMKNFTPRLIAFYIFTGVFFLSLFLLVYLEKNKTKEFVMGQEEIKTKELLNQLAILDYQLALCKGEIPDGPEYHRGFLK